VKHEAPQKSDHSHARPTRPETETQSGAGGFLPVSAGLVLAGLFYAVVTFVPWAPLQRYFLGHPVAIAATVLFCIALATLAGKWLLTQAQWRLISGIRDEDLMPAAIWGDRKASPADAYRQRHDVRHVTSRWTEMLDQLPGSIRNSRLVTRLSEVLHRQSLRGTSKHLADDLREVAARDADAAHDGFGLVRIIVWAIPMLGFLGTVIGITQTLGGLDFADGTAAVERLKSGLYVAFDTTALGLVLSVVAIFLQFPVERGEQRLLASIDARVGPLLSAGLPGDEMADDPTHLIVGLCDGIRIAVAESLASQTQLWRQTIDEANAHWQSVHETDADQFARAIDSTLTPTLNRHAAAIDESFRSAIEGQASMTELQQHLISHTEKLALLYHQTDKLHVAQAALDGNLKRLDETNRLVLDHENEVAKLDDGMADAVRVLARAVDVLSMRMTTGEGRANSTPRRAA